MLLANFLDATQLNDEAQSFVRLELSTGCALCGRRLLSENNLGTLVRPGTVIFAVDDEHGVTRGAYAICQECDE